MSNYKKNIIILIYTFNLIICNSGCRLNNKVSAVGAKQLIIEDLAVQMGEEGKIFFSAKSGLLGSVVKEIKVTKEGDTKNYSDAFNLTKYKGSALELLQKSFFCKPNNNISPAQYKLRLAIRNRFNHTIEESCYIDVILPPSNSKGSPNREKNDEKEFENGNNETVQIDEEGFSKEETERAIIASLGQQKEQEEQKKCEELCSICWGYCFDEVIQIDCSHVFHGKCFEEILCSNQLCPICSTYNPKQVKTSKKEKDIGHLKRVIEEQRENKCSSCGLDFFAEVIGTDCFHFFHKSCFQELLRHSNRLCPVCRSRYDPNKQVKTLKDIGHLKEEKRKRKNV